MGETKKAELAFKQFIFPFSKQYFEENMMIERVAKLTQSQDRGYSEAKGHKNASSN